MHRPLFNVAVITSALLLGACTAKPIKEPGITPGNWSLQTPEGKRIPVRVSEFREYEYHFHAAGLPFSGAYNYKGGEKTTECAFLSFGCVNTFSGGELVMTKPDSPRMGGYVWSKKSEREVILREEAPFEHTQQRLVPSVMTLPQ